jgi:hypothetical protein
MMSESGLPKTMAWSESARHEFRLLVDTYYILRAEHPSVALIQELDSIFAANMSSVDVNRGITVAIIIRAGQ